MPSCGCNSAGCFLKHSNDCLDLPTQQIQTPLLNGFQVLSTEGLLLLSAFYSVIETDEL